MSKSYTGEAFKDEGAPEAQEPDTQTPDHKSVEDVLAIRARLARSKIKNIRA